MTAVRDKARQVLKIIPELGQEIRSTLGTPKATPDSPMPKTNPLFKTVTNLEHATLQASWDELWNANDDSKPGMTSCNAFVGYYGALTTGYGDNVRSLGVFDLPERLARAGITNCFIESKPDLKPKFGDICLWRKQHIDVALDFVSDTRWQHADGGQGGRKKRKTGQGLGYDIVKRVEQDWDPNVLRGWLDLDLFMAALEAKNSAPVPDWLQTWWLVKWRGDSFYYRFANDRKVAWTKHRPMVESQPAPGDGEQGRFVIDKANNITIHWPSSDETFQWKPDYSIMGETMKGLNGGDMTAAETYFY
jgi:hypothetical protein